MKLNEDVGKKFVIALYTTTLMKEKFRTLIFRARVCGFPLYILVDFLLSDGVNSPQQCDWVQFYCWFFGTRDTVVVITVSLLKLLELQVIHLAFETPKKDHLEVISYAFKIPNGSYIRETLPPH